MDEAAKCLSCGSKIEERQYQMRAADEAHTSVFSCPSCPVDASRIDMSSPRNSVDTPYPRRIHLRTASETSLSSKKVRGTSYFLRVSLQNVADLQHLHFAKNTRHLCALVDEASGMSYTGYYWEAGPHKGTLCRLREDEVLSPKCSTFSALEYSIDDKTVLRSREADGSVCCIDVSGVSVYLHSRFISMHRELDAVVSMPTRSVKSLRMALNAVCSVGGSWHSISSFIPRDTLSQMNNLSPRAWDSKRIQKKGALYAPKIDGERVYVVVYKGVAHVFSKGKGFPHVGCIPLNSQRAGLAPVFVDAENTVSHGIFFIDMLTDHKGVPSPRTRDYAWSRDQFLQLARSTGMISIRIKPHVGGLIEAESISRSMACPTDGVVALWPGTTTARKMKKEKSVELEVSKSMELVTSEGDKVLEGLELPSHTVPGDIVEVRMKLCGDGKGISVSSVFKRTDKTSANSSAAVSAILSSFNSVRRDDETRRREVLMWCDSLRLQLVKMAMAKKGDRKVAIDVGTGTGQSLDALRVDEGVSYILIEPSTEKCEMLKRRTGVSKVVSDPRALMYSLRSLKSGLQTYLIANMELEDVTSDEEIMGFIHREIAFVSATFSAHFVVSQLYDVCRYWGIPMVGCIYPYDNVDVGCDLVSGLGVSMSRTSETQCTVRWGRDSQYDEPYTTTAEYSTFCSVVRGAEIVSPPSKNLDEDVYGICSKVYAVYELGS